MWRCGSCGRLFFIAAVIAVFALVPSLAKIRQVSIELIPNKGTTKHVQKVFSGIKSVFPIVKNVLYVEVYEAHMLKASVITHLLEKGHRDFTGTIKVKAGGADGPIETSTRVGVQGEHYDMFDGTKIVHNDDAEYPFVMEINVKDMKKTLHGSTKYLLDGAKERLQNAKENVTSWEENVTSWESKLAYWQSNVAILKSNGAGWKEGLEHAEGMIKTVEEALENAKGQLEKAKGILKTVEQNVTSWKEAEKAAKPTAEDETVKADKGPKAEDSSSSKSQGE